MKTRPLVLLLLFLLCSCAHRNPAPAGGAGWNPFSALVRFYRDDLDHLSAVRSSECPMHPSCSAYAIMSMEKHGFPMGWIMGLDRLMRCGRNETAVCPLVVVDGRKKCWDPPERNDFWWHVPPGPRKSPPPPPLKER